VSSPPFQIAIDLLKCSRLYNDPVLSDVKIKQVCDDGKTREYFAHKAILCAQSSYFLKMFTGHFKVRPYNLYHADYSNVGQESTANDIELRDDQPDHFEFALRFIYTFECRLSDMNQGTRKDNELEQMKFLLGVYTIVDKYDITRLVGPVKTHFETILRACTDTKILSAVVKAHYNAKSEWGHVMGMLISSVLLDLRHQFTQSNSFTQLCQEFPAFAVDIMSAMGKAGCTGCLRTAFLTKTATKGLTYYCSYCRSAVKQSLRQ
jgi:hypothetical protein